LDELRVVAEDVEEEGADASDDCFVFVRVEAGVFADGVEHFVKDRFA
jgi:hypothetical protein